MEPEQENYVQADDLLYGDQQLREAFERLARRMAKQQLDDPKTRDVLWDDTSRRLVEELRSMH